MKIYEIVSKTVSCRARETMMEAFFGSLRHREFKTFCRTNMSTVKHHSAFLTGKELS